MSRISQNFSDVVKPVRLLTQEITEYSRVHHIQGKLISVSNIFTNTNHLIPLQNWKTLTMLTASLSRKPCNLRSTSPPNHLLKG